MLVDNYSVFYVIKGDFALCTLFYETAIKNEVKGRAAEIVETGFEFGLSQNDICGVHFLSGRAGSRRGDVCSFWPETCYACQCNLFFCHSVIGMLYKIGLSQKQGP